MQFRAVSCIFEISSAEIFLNIHEKSGILETRGDGFFWFHRHVKQSENNNFRIFNNFGFRVISRKQLDNFKICSNPYQARLTNQRHKFSNFQVQILNFIGGSDLFYLIQWLNSYLFISCFFNPFSIFVSFTSETRIIDFWCFPKEYRGWIKFK